MIRYNDSIEIKNKNKNNLGWWLLPWQIVTKQQIEIVAFSWPKYVKCEKDRNLIFPHKFGKKRHHEMSETDF